MYEFLGAVTARSAMIEGAANQISTVSACIGLLIMQGVAWYTSEDIELYAVVLIKFAAAWVVVGIALGVVVAIMSMFRFQADWNPRTRAWPSGPKLPAFFMAFREVFSALASLFIPMTDATDHILRYGLGYGRFAISITVLLVVTTIAYMYLDAQAAIAPPAGGQRKKKKAQ